jgi:hypothetical protein
MLTFDGSNRDQCEVRRSLTNTPLQALVLLNDPQVLEASRVLAERLSLDKSVDGSISDKIEKAFRLIVCRRPDAKEKELLLPFYEKEKNKLIQSPQKVEQLLHAGEYKHLAVPDKTETAALMQVIHTIYNLEESVAKT